MKKIINTSSNLKRGLYLRINCLSNECLHTRTEEVHVKAPNNPCS